MHDDRARLKVLRWLAAVNKCVFVYVWTVWTWMVIFFLDAFETWCCNESRPQHRVVLLFHWLHSLFFGSILLFACCCCRLRTCVRANLVLTVSSVSSLEWTTKRLWYWGDRPRESVTFELVTPKSERKVPSPGARSYTHTQSLSRVRACVIRFRNRKKKNRAKIESNLLD